MNPETTPVILAIGEETHRIDDLADAKEPVDLIAAAMRAAENDAGASILSRLDGISVIGIVSWLYENPAALLCEKLNISPRSAIKAGMGGEKPIRLIHEAALAIQRGDAQALAIAGGEAQNSFRKARRSKTRFDWTPRATREEAWGDIEDTMLGIPRQARELGVQSPVHVYPLFENAYSARIGVTPTESMRQSAEIWSAFAAETVDNPYAWSRTAYDANTIATISETNRMVSFPYPKLMVANDSVNQAAAIIVSSLAFARQLGVADDKLIYFHGGAAAKEPDNVLKRARYDVCPAMEAVLERAAVMNGGAGSFDLAELYSCFPVVPKLAIDILRENGVRECIAPSVAGGLTFFGGPMNNYMSHAICAMTRRLRAGDGKVGLLYGQGGVMTKHHALIVSSAPSTEPLNADYSVQDIADAKREEAPVFDDSYTGPATIETYSAYYGVDGEPAYGFVIAATPDGNRAIASIKEGDTDLLTVVTNFNQNLVGEDGRIDIVDGVAVWTAA